MSQNFEKIEKNSIIFKFIFFFKRKIQFKKNFFKVFWAKFKHIKKGKKLKSERFSPAFTDGVGFFLWSRDHGFLILSF